MKTTQTLRTTQAGQPVESAQKQRSLSQFYAPIDEIARNSASLVASTAGEFLSNGERYEVKRYLHVGPQGGDTPVRIGIFAGIHGDEPAPSYAIRRLLTLLEAYPEVARGYCLFFYPVCNPVGFERNTRASGSERDLNREFWQNSPEPEVGILERELREQRFHGIVSLHSDDTSDGLYGFVAGATLTQNLLRPALAEAASVLPLNHRPQIDGFKASEGIIRTGYDGVLSAPSSQRPKPFEIILESPADAPQVLQEQSLLVALEVILREYRKLLAYAPNL